MPPDITPPRLSDFLTVQEAARILGVSSDTLRNWDRSGKLVAMRHPLNGYRLYDRTKLLALLDRLDRAGNRDQT